MDNFEELFLVHSCESQIVEISAKYENMEENTKTDTSGSCQDMN